MSNIKTNIIINGNCIDALKQLPDNSIDLIFADPPYWMRTSNTLLRVEGTKFNGVEDEWDKFESNEDYARFTKNWLSECYRVLKKNGSFWVIGGMQCIYTIGGIMQELGFWIINDVIWHKTNPTPNFKGTRLQNSHETLIWATKSQSSKYTFNYKTAKELNINIADYNKGNRKQLGSVWSISVVNGNERLKDNEGVKLHSTQKPEELLYKIINISSKINDIVLDPFAGTMTTGKVAKQTGRKYIMIEQDEKYCHYGTNRIEKTKEKIGDIELATFDIKPLKVSLKDMIENGFLHIGEQFYLKNINHKNVYLNSEGKLTDDNRQILDIHSGAAQLSNKKAHRVNGFDYWYVIRENKLVSINEIRELYREHLSKESI
ncbi:site-specific DNA-methyltransferase [Mycoplasma bovis]|uniref:DNA-methyltransferase n=1 Tax=Mycoplasmopsis bovis TaxID=28903 RepID=UPI001BDDF402|nr:site-specific DNA-methyltransferase [Mycoplasmopsis bovis]MBT1316145.1 site-specific DNA-methyltransferase [Mycoplasmopsis bovis]MBT1323077.1 site-specific DNA-methyltransferase [Mycoplasmopsis bovis]MBT1367736.1 site-specific DNA-methyltransferase [Mycoplasmopsis bovis]